MAHRTFGEMLKERRLALNLSLRAFCEQNHEDPGNWSKMERGVLLPPVSKIRLLEIARKLGFAEDAGALREMMDLASAASGRIPEDIMSEKELVEKLPVVFRTLRGDVPTQEELLSLADIIRQELTPRNEPAQ